MYDSTTGGNISPIINTIDREEYEENLKEKQRKHLEQVYQRKNSQWRPCFHDECPSCHGTGIKITGEPCIHMISCPCPKCTPSY